MAIQIRQLKADDLAILTSAGPDVFDHAVKPDLAAAFLARDDYFIIAALDGAKLVGMGSGFTYFHPDKPLEFFVNEVGVHDDYLRAGIATLMMHALFDCARAQGCTYAWLGTETDNIAANGLYLSLNGKMQQMNYFEFDLTKDAPQGS